MITVLFPSILCAILHHVLDKSRFLLLTFFGEYQEDVFYLSLIEGI